MREGEKKRERGKEEKKGETNRKGRGEREAKEEGRILNFDFNNSQSGYFPVGGQFPEH